MSIIQRASTLMLLLAAACAGSHASSSGGGGGDGDATIGQVVEGECQIADSSPTTEYLQKIGCTADFLALASEPLDATLSGARSVKVVFDRDGGNELYFQNSQLFQIHYAFVSTHLSGNGLPIVPSLASFNSTEYQTPDRRFILGAVTYYEGPNVWAFELSPYDTATAAMVAEVFPAIKAAAFFGPALRFHPTSDAVAAMAAGLPGSIPRVTTDQIYAGIDFQPLNVASSMGRLRFLKASELETSFLTYQDIVVLDQAPNDISVCQGIITEEFQTPLSHLNVLSRNRSTPNMGLRNAQTNAQLLALKDKLVQLTVGATTWSIREVTQAEAEEFWEAHKPSPMTLPEMDRSITELLDIEDVTPESDSETLRESLKKACNAFGGKAAQYSILAKTTGVPVKKAFGIPVYYYWQFMTENGFFDEVKALLADTSFTSDYAVRAAKLADMRARMLRAPVDQTFQNRLEAKLAADYPGETVRFRTSTNSEDLEGFPCAGCYESHTGDPADWQSVLDAIRETYASTWLFRTFEERAYYGVAHETVTMALLVHTNFPDEEANGVAVTANPFDASGLDPAFYVNVQYGGKYEVVHPVAGIDSDQFLYYFTQPNQPISFLAHSSLVPTGMTVLTSDQTYQLGLALNAIHKRFSAAYGPAAGVTGWYGMDVEFKFDNDAAPAEPPALYIKQARPYPQSGN